MIDPKELKTGDIVRISNSFFKSDNALYFVEHSPGDPGWSGSDHCLLRVTKKGKISKARDRICFWPISVCVSDPKKRCQALQWNRENAQIERACIPDKSEIIKYFRDLSADISETMTKRAQYCGENYYHREKDEQLWKFYNSVISHISK